MTAPATHDQLVEITEDMDPAGVIELPEESTDVAFFTSGTSYQPC